MTCRNAYMLVVVQCGKVNVKSTTRLQILFKIGKDKRNHLLIDYITSKACSRIEIYQNMAYITSDILSDKVFLQELFGLVMNFSKGVFVFGPC